MEAPRLKPVSSQGVRPLAVRLAVFWLAAVLAFGLWQAYGVCMSGCSVHAL